MMATRTERFKAAAERAAQAGNAEKKRKKLKSPTGRRKDGRANPASHNDGSTHAKRSGYALEGSLTARPSRKSTRKSANRQKNDSALRITATTAGRKRVPAPARGRR
jgi:hypothetical protein